MARMIHSLKTFRARNAHYFTRLRGDVARTNLQQLRRAGIAFGAMLLGYGLFTLAVFQNRALSGFYLLFVLLDLGFVCFACLYGRREQYRFCAVQAVCLAFVAAVLGFTICISVFPFPERPAIFFPLAYMLVSVLFLFPFWQIAGILTALTGLYLALVCGWKGPLAIRYDIFGGVTTWLLGFFFLYLILDLRLREGETRLELERLSRTDDLTGLPNRRSLEESMLRSYRRCQHSGLPVAALMVDIDHFKEYNDLYGHAAGDACLKLLGASLAEYAREQGIFAARYGGEEFLIVLPGCTEAEAMEHAGQVLGTIRACIPPEGHEITASLGAAVVRPGPKEVPDTLLERADAALYQAKRAGRDRAVFYRQEPAPEGQE